MKPFTYRTWLDHVIDWIETYIHVFMKLAQIFFIICAGLFLLSVSYAFLTVR